MPRGYFDKNVPQFRMPRSDGGPDSIGARYQGDVLQGKLSPLEAHAMVNARVAHAQASAYYREWNAGNCYVSPEDYDPVLRYHCRMKKPFYW